MTGTRQDGGEIADGRIASLVALSSIFATKLECIASEGLLPTKEDDILKQRQLFFSIRWPLSASSCPDSGSLALTMETAIFVKSHLKKWLLSLPRGGKNSVNPVNLVILDSLSFLSRSRWADARCAASLSAY